MRVVVILILLGGCAKVDYDLNPWTTVMRHIIYEKK